MWAEHDILAVTTTAHETATDPNGYTWEFSFLDGSIDIVVYSIA